MRSLQSRKKFIHYHPKKLDVAFEIIKNRLDKKIITFYKIFIDIRIWS